MSTVVYMVCVCVRYCLKKAQKSSGQAKVKIECSTTTHVHFWWQLCGTFVALLLHAQSHRCVGVYPIVVGGSRWRGTDEVSLGVYVPILCQVTFNNGMGWVGYYLSYRFIET